jgi:hypothetical protein
VREREIFSETLAPGGEREIFRNLVTLTLPSPSVRERENFPETLAPGGGEGRVRGLRS